MKAKNFYVFVVVLMLATTSCERTVSVTGISLDRNSIEMIIGDKDVLVATVVPANYTGQLIWKSSDTSIVVVEDGGVISALNAGNAIVTVSVGSFSASCNIEVMKKPSIGDLFYSDGTWETEYNPSKTVIGIIFQTYEYNSARFGTAEINALKEKGIETPRGLVLSCRVASVSSRWSESLEDIPDLKNCITKNDNYLDISGLANTQIVRNIDEDLSDYPAFRSAAIEFQEVVPAPDKTTGWFLPSAGQCWDILQNLCGVQILADPIEQVSEENAPFVWGDCGNVTKALNDAMTNVPSEQKDLLGDQIWFWTSTEYSADAAMDWDITSFGFISSNYLSKTLGGAGTVRAVLAF